MNNERVQVPNYARNKKLRVGAARDMLVGVRLMAFRLNGQGEQEGASNDVKSFLAQRCWFLLSSKRVRVGQVCRVESL